MGLNKDEVTLESPVPEIELQRRGLASVELVAPLSSLSLFWQPRFVRRSAALRHLPFIYWLVDDLRPRSFLSLGGDGVVHFGICQAIEKLELDCKGFGIGVGGGSPEAESDAATFNRDNYSSISSLIDSADDPRAHALRTGRIDLLHVDQTWLRRTDYSIAMAELRDTWLPRLSPTGALVIHGVNKLTPPQRTGLFDSLGARGGSFAFEEGDGFALLIPAAASERLARLCALKLGEPGHASFLRIFARLGELVESAALARLDKDQQAALSNELSEARSILSNAEEQQLATLHSLQALKEAYDDRHRKAAELAARVYDLDAALQLSSHERDGALGQLADARIALERCAEVEASREAAAAELRGAVETLRADLQGSSTKADELRRDRDQISGELARCQDQLLEAQCAARTERERLQILVDAEAEKAAALRLEYEANRNAWHIERLTLTTALREAETATEALRADQERLQVLADSAEQKLSDLQLEKDADRQAWDSERSSLQADYERLQTMVEASEQKLAGLRRAAEDRHIELIRCQQDFAEERKSLQGAHINLAKALTAQLEEMHERLADQTMLLANERSARAQEGAESQSAIERLRAEHARYDEKIGHLQAALAAASGLAEDLADKLKASERRGDALEADLRAIRESTSWRLSGPARSLVAKFRKSPPSR